MKFRYRIKFIILDFQIFSVQKILLTILLLIAIPLHALAQGDYRSGYIVKINGDSVAGLVQYPTNKISKKYCIYKQGKRSKSQRFTPAELTAFGYFGDRRYESKRVVIKGEPKNIFAEVLVKGNLSLYLYEGIFYLERDNLIELPVSKKRQIQTETSTFISTDKVYISILNQVINECGLKADQIRYEQRDLTNVVQNFNRCKGMEGTLFNENLPWTKINLEVLGGYNSSMFQIEGFEDSSFGVSKSVIAGGGIEIYSPKLNDKILFSIESIYMRSLLQGYREYSIAALTVRSDIFIDAAYLKIPIGLRYNFWNELRTPYLKAGFIAMVDLNSSIKIIEEKELAGVVNTEIIQRELVSNRYSGIWIGAGYSNQILGRVRAFVEFRYEMTTGFAGDVIQSPASLDSFSIMLGVRF